MKTVDGQVTCLQGAGFGLLHGIIPVRLLLLVMAVKYPFMRKEQIGPCLPCPVNDTVAGYKCNGNALYLCLGASA
ncbi:hypothetical protein D3C73_1554600 [compost metagenome]